MANLNVIYKIAADVTALERGVAQGVATMGRLEQRSASVGSALRGVGAALGAALSLQQISGAVTKVTEATSRLQDLSTKAGISAEALQTLGFAAQQNGVQLESVVSGLARMSNNLIGGGKGTVEAVQALGLSLDTLRASTPDSAFQQIATAIAGIEDPMQRSRLAMELFGKAGADMLPLLLSDLETLRAQAQQTGVVMTNDLVKAGDDFGDRVDVLRGRLETLQARALAPVLSGFLALPDGVQLAGAALLNFVPLLTSLGTTILAAGGPMAVLGGLKTALVGLAGLLTMPAGLVAAAVVGLVAIWYKWDAIKDIAARVYEAVRTYLVDKFESVVGAIRRKVEAISGFFATLYDKVVGHSYVPDLINGIANEFGRLQSVMVSPTQISSQLVIKTIAAMVTQVTATLITGSRNWGQVISAGLQTAVGGSPSSASSTGAGIGRSALAIGVGSLGAGILGGAVGGQTGSTIGSAAAGIGGLALTSSGLMSSATISGAIALGAATMGIGAAAVGAYYGLKKLFGASEEQKINPIRQGFIDAAGGLGALNTQLDRAAGAYGQLAVQELLAAENQEQYNKAIAGIDEILSFQTRAFQTLDETVKRYGFTLEELGPALQRQELEKQAAQLYQDFNVLIAAGINVNTVITRMGGSLQDFYAKAVATGQEIPRQMEPMLQKMIEMGLLVDANGQKVTDLSGIKFSETMTEGFDRVVGSVERLIRVIARGLGVALEDIVDKAGLAGQAIAGIPAPANAFAPSNTTMTEWRPPTQSTYEDVPGFASGSGGFRDFGSGTLAMLHGREAVVPWSQRQSGGELVVHNYIMLDGRVIGEQTERYLDAQLRTRRKVSAA